MNLNHDIVYRCSRLGPLHQRHPGRSRGLVRHHDRPHGKRLPYHFVIPQQWVGLLGLAPLALGVRGLVAAARANDGEQDSLITAAGLWPVAALTIANGADNLSIYIPLFRPSSGVRQPAPYQAGNARVPRVPPDETTAVPV